MLANSSGWPWSQKKNEEQDWKMMQIPNGSGSPWRRTKKTRLEKMVATTQLWWPWRQRKKEEQKKDWIGFGVDLTWIEIGVFKNKIFQGMNSLAL